MPDSTDSRFSFALCQETKRLIANNQGLLQDVHKDFTTGKLRVIAGAGLSVGVGFPAWSTLVERMLLRFARQVMLSKTSAESLRGTPTTRHGIPSTDASDKARCMRMADAIEAFISEPSRELIQKLISMVGMTAIPGMIQDSVGRSDYHQLLSRSLYSDARLHRWRSKRALALTPVRQLASMAWQAARSGQPNLLYTTNFDDIIEMSLDYIGAHQRGGHTSDDALAHYAFMRESDRPTGLAYKDPAWLNGLEADCVPYVTHLHGHIAHCAEDGTVPEPGSPLVLSERDYFYMQKDGDGARAVRDKYDEIFGQKDSRVLFVGMSLSDSSFRTRLLQKLTKLGDVGGPRPAKHVAFFRSSGDQYLDALACDAFEQQLNVRAILLSSWAQLPPILRYMQFAGESPCSESKWIIDSQAWLTESNIWANEDGAFSEQSRKHAWEALVCARDHITKRFECDSSEHVHIEAHVPLRDGKRIGLWAATDLPLEAMNSPDAGARVLNICGNAAQGAAGLAFQMGGTLDIACGGKGADYNFTDDLREAWSRRANAMTRDWSSIYAATILDGPLWTPVMTICVTSNKRLPFWRRDNMTEVDLQFFDMFLRSIGTKLAAETTAITIPPTKPTPRKDSSGKAHPGGRRQKNQSSKLTPEKPRVRRDSAEKRKKNGRSAKNLQGQKLNKKNSC